MSTLELDDSIIQSAVIQGIVERYARDPNLRRDIIEHVAGYGRPLEITEKEVAARLKASGIDHITKPDNIEGTVDALVRRRVEAHLTTEQLGTVVGNAVARLLADAYGKRIKVAAKKMVEAAMRAMADMPE